MLIEKTMTIKQLSIFIENQSGTLINVLDVLKQAGIQIVASTIADTAEYGIYRMICNEPNRAYEALRTAGIAVALSDVFAIALDNTPGRAADAIRAFSDAHISIAYLYSFLLKDNGIDPEATFRDQFISSDLKMMKPAPEFYNYVIQRIGQPPQEILFIDDNKANVDGARAVGLDARLYNPGTDLGLLLSDC